MTSPGRLPDELTQRALDVLRRRPAGLVTDLDGTISSLAATPGEALVSPPSCRALSRLARRLAVVAVISGRPAAEAREMLGLNEVLYIGNHGFETWEDGRALVHGGAKAYIAQIRRALREVGAVVNIAGVVLEDKGVTASLHYRSVSDPERARRAILDAAKVSPAAYGLRLVEGKMVVELRPPLAMDKGTAVADLAAQRGLKGVLYLGDDATDKDAFDSLRHCRQTVGIETLTVCVGDVETPPEVVASADYVVESVTAVGELLTSLADALGEGG